MQDVFYGLRLLRKQPLFTVVSVLTIALGIGATTTLVSIAYGVLLKPLPWPASDRLVRIAETRQGSGGRIRGTVTNATYLAWREKPSTIEGIGGYGSTTVTAVAGRGEPLRVQVASVTPTLFPLLGVRPFRGRVFTDDEGPVGGRGAYFVAPSMILSYGLWQQWFGGSDDAIGRVVQIDGKPTTVVGVMPRDFVFPDPETRAWIPRAVGAVLGDGGARRIQIFSALARLKPGVTPAQASAEGTARARSAPDPGLAAVAMFGSDAPPDITATPAVEAMTADVRPAVLVLLAAVVLLLAAAIANVGALQLARATARAREIAVRAALGAGGARLVRQLTIESLLVGALGGAVGVALAVVLNRIVPALLPPDFPRVSDITIDVRVLLVALGAVAAASVGGALLPALQARRIDLVEALADDSAASAAGVWRSRSARVRTLVMAGQLAVACVLLIGATLLVRSFVALLHADRGYDPAGVLTARVDLPAAYTEPRRVAFADAIVERLRAVPGVERAAIGTALPLLTSGGAYAFAMPSPRDPAIQEQVHALVRVVSPDFFQALRLRLVQGRTLADSDTATGQAVVVVNRSFARRYLAPSPIGARVPMPFGPGRPDCVVVGVVEDMRQENVTDPETPEIFASYRQMSRRLLNSSLVVVLRTKRDPIEQVAAVRTAVHELDPLLAVDSTMTMEERVAQSLARPRTYAMLLSIFALSALAVAAVGLFGVLSYSVTQRSREIGVRTALGACRRHIVALVVKQALGVACGGLMAGIAASLALTRYLAASLYGVGVHDAGTIALVAVVLLAVSVLACVVPARRAAQVDPLEVLRTS